MSKEEFSLLFHRAQVNLVAFKMLYEPEAFEAMQRMVEMAVEAEREACAKVCDDLADKDKLSNYYRVASNAIRSRSNT